MVLSPEQLDDTAQPHAEAVAALEDLGWVYIIRTLAKYGMQDSNQSPDDWKQELLQHAADITKYMTKQSAATFTPIVNQVSMSIRQAPLEDQHDVLQWLGRISGKAGQSGTVAESRAVNRLVTNAQKETVQYLNLAKRNMNRNATAAFKRIVSDSALAMKNGMPRDKALLIASRRWSMRGVPALIDKAGKSWQPDVYMRLVVTNQAKQASNLIALQHAKEYETFVKVSSHAACRPTHLQYQGQIYSVNGDTSKYPDLYSSTSYGSAGGLCGINCHHYVMPYVPSYGTPDVDSLSPEENNTRYQSTQKQRALEREVRAAQRQSVSAQLLGDRESQNYALTLVKKRRKQLNEYISSANLVHVTSQERDMLTIPRILPKHLYLPDATNAVLPVEKLTKYALDPDNKHGGADKAKVFASALGYNKDNYKDLMDQVLEMLPNARAIEKKKDQYGQRYQVDLPITGPNGQTHNVVTAWLQDAKTGKVRLTSIYVKDKVKPNENK